MPEEYKDVVSRIYENFLMRDLTYVFGGGLLLASVKYAYDGNLMGAIDYVSQNFLKFIVFVVISYFVGLIVQEGVSFINIKIKSKSKEIYIVKTAPEVPKSYNDYFLLMADIQKNYGVDTIRRIERTIYLKHVGATIGSASLISCLILLVPLISDTEANIRDRAKKMAIVCRWRAKMVAIMRIINDMNFIAGSMP